MIFKLNIVDEVVAPSPLPPFLLEPPLAVCQQDVSVPINYVQCYYIFGCVCYRRTLSTMPSGEYNSPCTTFVNLFLVNSRVYI